jgi:virulence factor
MNYGNKLQPIKLIVSGSNIIFSKLKELFMEKLINYVKNLRKRNYINKSYNTKYAFVGMGNHSIHNLYPILNYLRIDLKYIVTHSEKNAQLVNDNFPNVNGTNDFNKVLNDSEIGGIFICANPNAHFNLLKEALKKDKNVFVEKPPCKTYKELQELIEIENSSKGSCFVGLQKQYAPANLQLKKLIKNRCSYNYRFVTGAYPEGDPFLDIFIHPLSLVSFLFGSSKLEHFSIQQSKSGITIFLQLQHDRDTIGSIELSTAYSWSDAQEKLIVNSEEGVFKATNSENLTFTPKQGTILNIPKEKIFGDKMTSQIVKRRNNFSPVFENNQLYSSGYYTEIDNFVNFCEGKKSINNSTLADCESTYQLIESIKEKK